jgi:molybdopterin synthase sulfur carrier subunit
VKLPPRVKIRLFHELRATIGQSELEIEANTLNDVLDALISRQRSLKEMFFDSKGSLRGYTQFYVNNKVQNLPDLFAKLDDGDLIVLIPLAAGG